MKFVGKELPTRRERDAEQIAVEVYSSIRRIVESKKANGIDPARASYRELRDIFTEKHFKHLDFLIERGAVKVTQAINWDTYEIVYAVYERLMAQMHK